MGCVMSVEPRHVHTSEPRRTMNRKDESMKQLRKNGGTKKRFSSMRMSTMASKSGTSSNSSRLKRLPDRQITNSTSILSGETDEYVERMVSYPEEDDELATEIAKRENSAVREKVTKYDQLHAKSKMVLPLVDVQGPKLSRQSTIYSRVQSFEVAERQSKVVVGPKIEDLRRRREMNDPNRFARADALTLPVYSL